MTSFSWRYRYVQLEAVLAKYPVGYDKRTIIESINRATNDPRPEEAK